MLCKSEGEPRSDKWNGMLSETENTRTEGRKNYAVSMESRATATATHMALGHRMLVGLKLLRAAIDGPHIFLPFVGTLFQCGKVQGRGSRGSYSGTVAQIRNDRDLSSQNVRCLRSKAQIWTDLGDLIQKRRPLFFRTVRLREYTTAARRGREIKSEGGRRISRPLWISK